MFSKKTFICKNIKVMKSAIELYVSQKVKEYRDKRNWSQQYLADCINLSASFVSNRENPKTDDAFNLDHIDALAKIFECKIYDFLPPYPLDNKE